MECDCDGCVYYIEDHEITLRVPKGALLKGTKVHFEIGVSLDGPFHFPKESTPISPIVWLCIIEENAELRQPFQLTLPHYLTKISGERMRYHEVQFAKAHHKYENFTYNFETYECTDKAINDQGYAVLESQHFCFYCLVAKKSRQVAMEAGYMFVRIEKPLIQKRKHDLEVDFCVIYQLKTCKKVCHNVVIFTYCLLCINILFCRV